MPACLGTERAASPGLATVVRTMRAGGAGEGMGAPGSAYEGRHPAGGFPLLFLLSRDHIALSLAFKPRDEAINFVDEMMQHHESFIVVRPAQHIEHEWIMRRHLNCVEESFSGAVDGMWIATLD